MGCSDGRAVATLEGYTHLVFSFVMSVDGSRIVTGGDRTIRVWDVESGRDVAKCGWESNWEWVVKQSDPSLEC